ncbi:hypothetical protein Cgig2_000653 [Carnegiea gigantea]|uniref:DUF4283 domain-containing protein n=1 Tax=Carnegiea gigantea TaxID=171969 RepID=A0A9Q1GFX9_9CARY|nr:hypothetical protein Cgig2_000653 [Carnegiea gigantea]
MFYFDAKPFLVKGWNPQMDLHTKCIKSLPIWVQLPELDIRFWGSGSLSKLGSIIRIPLKTDKCTNEKTMLKYARLLIDIFLEGPFPDYIDFFDEEEVLITQKVIYEWKPIKCTHCHMFGHEAIDCKKRKEVRTEWRPVSRDTQGEATTVQAKLTNDQQTANEGELFTPVPKRDAAKQPRQSAGQANPKTDDRRGGNEIQGKEIKVREDFMEQGDLQEMRWSGPYYSWTNKTIWSRIDRAVINIYWYNVFDFTQNQYLANGLSDHTSMMVKFPTTIKLKSRFQFYEIQLRIVIAKLRSLFSKFNRDNFADLRAQQEKARRDLVSIQMPIQSNPGDSSPFQVESNLRKLINYGDDNSRIFFAKAKQRKLASYIYNIKDAKGDLVEGFDQVGKAMQTYFMALLGE